MRRYIISLSLLGAVLLCLAVGPGAAQSTDTTNDPVKINKIRCWNNVGGSVSQPTWGATTPMGVGLNMWQVEYRVKNQGGKQISAIHWSFQFVNRDKKVVTEDFKSKRGLKPSKETTITETFEYDSKLMPENIEGNILVRRIEFDDGTSWQPDPKKSDSMLTEGPNNK